jgi:hypothetical protein
MGGDGVRAHPHEKRGRVATESRAANLPEGARLLKGSANIPGRARLMKGIAKYPPKAPVC